MDKAFLEQRIQRLAEELGKGRQQCVELTNQHAATQATCFRIEGAIEILREQLQALAQAEAQAPLQPLPTIPQEPLPESVLHSMENGTCLNPNMA